jgi:hypothetical protein
LDSPQTGFMPFLAGVGISFFSFIGLITATIQRKKGVVWKSIFRGFHWEKPLIVLGALFALFIYYPVWVFLSAQSYFSGFFQGCQATGMGDSNLCEYNTGFRRIWDF